MFLPKAARRAMCLALVLAGCTSTRSAADACRPFAGPSPEQKFLDLADAVPFRTYIALTRVGPFAHHYVVSAEGARARMPMMAAYYDAKHELKLSFGGDVAQSLREPPPEASGVTQAVRRELERRCPGARYRLRYAGEFRTLRHMTFSATDLRPGNERVGWLSEHEDLADATAEHFVARGYRHSNIIVFSGFGLIRVPAGSRWVAADAPQGAGEAGNGLVNLHERILAAARAEVAGKPRPRLADIPIAEPDRLLADKAEPRVHLVLSFRPRGGRPVQAILPLSVHDAVLGPAALSETEVRVGGNDYTVKASLGADAPLETRPQRTAIHFRGQLTVHILDATGIVFERSFPARGEVITMGDEASASYSIRIPGGSSPSPEDLLRRGKLPSAPGSNVEFRIETELKVRPPR